MANRSMCTRYWHIGLPGQGAVQASLLAAAAYLCVGALSDAAAATLTIADASGEEGEAIAFAVTLDKAVPDGFTVTPNFTDGVTVRGEDYSHLTATHGKDYRAEELTLEFAGTAGEIVNFTVPTIEDWAPEFPKVFTVGLSVSGTSHGVTATDTATGIIYDDDAAAASAASSSQIKDNGGTITIYSPPDPEFGRMEYECTIPKRVAETTDASLRFKHLQIACGARGGSIRTGAVAEFWSSGSATATKGSSGDWDYEFFHEKLKFYPTEKKTKRLGFRVNDDELGEGPEYFQFSLKWSTKVGLGWLGIWVTINESVHTITIWIDDDDEYNLSVSPASVTEAGGAKTVTVTAAVADDAVLGEARTLSIQVGKSGDLAVEGTDYQNVGNFDVTIPKGSSKGTGTFTLTPVVDAHLEPNERITVAGSGKSDINGKVLRPRVNSTAMWLNDSSVVTLSASPSVSEGGGAQTVTVTATSTGTAQRATPLTVSVGKSGDAAVEGTDYQPVSDFTVTIPSGSKTGTGTFQITPINDTALEDDETITLSGSFPGGTVTDGSLTLLDNDVTLSLSPASTGEEAGAKTVTVTARAKTARTAARALTVSVGKVGDSAETGTDYGAVADFSLTIPANQASGTATFTFTPRDDKTIEGTEKVTVGGTGTGLDVGRATLTITETDTTDFVITLSPSRVSEGQNWTNLKVQVTTTDGYTVSRKVTCRFTNGGGSATWNSDYNIEKDNKSISPPGSPGTSIMPTITINPGNTYGYEIVRLKTENDNTVEGDETVQIKGYTSSESSGPHKSCVSSDNPRTVDSDPDPADLTIVDDETSIDLSASPSSVAEDAGDTSVTVTAKMGGNRNAPADMPVTVTVGNSTDSATSGTDYEALDAFKITIPQGKKSATKTLTFTPKDDTLAEDDETITLSGKTAKTSVSSTQLTIDDDDDTGITLTASPGSVSEGGGAKTVTVTAKTDGTTFPAPRNVDVQVGKTGDGATEGTDYQTVANFTLTIPFGKTKGTGTFTLTPVDDSTVESDESISIDGTTSASDTVTGTSVTLADDDASITLAASPSSVAEDGGAKTVTVTATAAAAVEADTALTIAVGQSDDSATEGTDYTTVSDFTLTIKSGKTKGTGTFTLTPIDDALYEGASESLTVSGSATGVRVGTASVAITDDDPETEVNLSLKPTRAKECTADTEVWVTAKLPDSADAVAEDRKITVSVGKSGDGAVSGTDYAAVDDFDLTIPAGHRSALTSFDLQPVDDDDVEGDEKLTVHGTAKRLTVKNEPQMTLVDDDQPIVILTMDPATIPENDTETSVTVTASLFTGDFCGETHDVAASAASMASTSASMVGASAAEIARAVLGSGARAVSESSARTVTVSVGDTGDTATSGTDYTAVSSFTISIPAGKSSGTATFTTTASLDKLLEPSETLTVKGTSTGTTVTPTGGHVANKDQVNATLTASPSSLSEGAAATSVTLTLNTGGVTSAERFEVPIRVTGGTATAGTDFGKVKDFDLVLAADATSGTATFTLTPTDDTLVEGDETLNVIIPDTELSAAVTLTDDDDGTITLSVSPTSASEADSAETVTVTAATGGATFAADRTVSVTVGDSADSATSGTDYAAVSSFDITITAGQTSGSGTFTLTPTQDTVVEGEETISVDGTSTGVTVNGASVALTDDDSTGITLRLSPSSVSEKDEATTVTVTAATDGDTFKTDRTVTVSVGESGDSATSGIDYAAVADLDITITAGDTTGSGTFTLTPKQDTLVEGDEAVTVSGTATGLTVTGNSATITDDDTAPEVNLSANPSSVAEDAAATSVTVTATFSNSSTYPVAKTVSVTVGDSADGATSGTDYAAVTGFDITISAGQSSGSASFTLTPTDDTLVEGGETISIDGDSTGLAVNATTLTLADDDDAPAINLSANPSSVSEGAAATSVTVTAQFSNTNTYTADKTVTVTVGDSADGATSGTDYSAVADFDIVIKAGDTSATGTFTLTPKDDTLVEGNESFSVGGASTGMTVNGGSVALTDDDGAPVVNLSVNPSTVSEGAAATSVTVTATFSNTSTYGAAKKVSVTVGDSTDSATSGTDYAAVSAFDVTIAAGKSTGSATFTLTPSDDAVVEGNEALSLAGSSDLTVHGASVTLTDDDGPPAINLSANPSSVSEGAGATTVTLTAAFSNGNTYPGAKTVSVTVGDSADSAVSGTDYAAVTSFDVTIAAGQASGTATFTLTPTQDRSIEGNETLSLSGTSELTVNGASMALADDDSTAITLSTSPSSVAEDDSATAVTVTAETDGDTFAVARTVRVKVGSAGDSATSGTDYAAVASFDITIAAGAKSGTGKFTLTPTEDNLIEGDEAVSVSGTSTGLKVDAASVTIDDNDEPKIILDIEPFLETDPDKLPEGAGATRVTVTAGTTGGVFELDRQIHVTVGKKGDSAVFGTDYDTPSVAFHVLIKASDTEGEKTFTLTPTDDVLVEGAESLTLEGSAAGLEVTTATITIKDDDVPAMAISASPVAVAEGAGATTVTVTVETGGVAFTADRKVGVTVGAAGDSATSATDYAPVAAFDIPITAGQTSAKGTFTLLPTDDSLVEGDEAITLAGSAAGLAIASISVTITDDDDVPSINLSATPPRVAESAGATAVTVTAGFSNASTYGSDTTVTVSVGAAGDSAVEGADYAAVAAFAVTIAAGASTGTAQFALAPTDDTLAEGDESLAIGGVAAGLTVDGTSIVLLDDDGAPSVILSAAPSSVAEGAGATPVTVTAAFSNDTTYAADTTVRVSVGAADDSATSGADYATVADFTVTIAAGRGSGSAAFTLAPVRDSLVEGSETIAVGGTSPRLQVYGTQVALTDDDEAPTIRLSVAPLRIAEGAGETPATVTASFSNDSSYAVDTTVTVTVGEAEDSAESGVDYTPVEPFEVTITAGRRSGSAAFTLTPVQDALVEGAESIGLEGAARLAVVGADMMLTDDDAAPAVALSLSPPRVAEGAGDTPVAVTAAFTNDSVYAADTTVTVTVGDAADSAEAGVDYATPTDFEVTIAAGQTSGVASFTLAPVQDTLLEADERITVSGASTLPVSGTAATLADDDAAPGIELSVAPGRVAEGAGTTAVAVTAAFTNATTYLAETVVTVSVGANGDAAAAGTDYARVADFELTIEAGASSGAATFALDPTQDTLLEDDETITVSGAAAGIAVGAATVALADDDRLPAVQLSAAPARVAEDDGPTTVTVTATFSNDSTFATDARVAVTVGAADDSAVSGADYAPIPSFDVVVPAGATSGQATFALAPTQDTLIEGDESIALAGAAPGLAVTGADVELADDDGLPTVGLSASLSSLAEGAGEAAVTVTATFSNESTFEHDTMVAVTVGGPEDSAVPGTDYAPVAGFEVTVPAGATVGEATFALTPTQDTLIEGEERIALAGTAPGLAVTGTDIALTDDDAAPTVRLSASPSSLGEGAGESAVTVTAAFTNDSTFAHDTTVAVTVGGPDDSADPGTDYAPVAGFEVTVPAGATVGEATFALTPTQDTLIEGEERIALAGTAPGLAVTGTDIALTDDDALPGVRLSASPSSLGEGAGESAVTVTAAFTNDSTFAHDTTVAVTVGGPDDSADPGTDYAVVGSFEVTVPAGATSGQATFALRPTPDTLIEGEESIVLLGTASNLTVTTADIALTDDDAVPTVRLSASPSSVGEGAGESAVTVAASFTNDSTFAHDTTVSVAVGGPDDSAAAGTDYAPVPGFEVTVPAGATSGQATFALRPTPDTLIEGEESIVLLGTASNLTVTTADIALTDDDAVPTVRLSASPSSVGEGAGESAVTVAASFTNDSTFAHDTTVSVAVGGPDDSAVPGTDYAVVGSFEVTVPAGATSGRATFVLAPVQDTLVEGEEGIGLAGAAPGLEVAAAELALADDDALPAVRLSASPASVGEGAGESPVTVTASFSNGSTFADAVMVAVSVGAPEDGAASGTDYAAVPAFEVTVPAGATSGRATFVLAPTQDTLVEGEEGIGLTGAASGLTVNGTRLALADDDAPPTVDLVVEPRRITEDAGATALRVTATFVGSSTYAADTRVTVSVGDAQDSAVAGSDYATVADFVVTVPAGSGAGSVASTLVPLQDALFEPDETISVAGSAVGLVVRGTSATLADDDRTREPVRFSVADAAAEEGEPLRFAVRLSRSPVGRSVAVRYRTEDRVAKAGEDYAEISGTLTFAPGEIEAIVLVQTLDDAFDEGAETLALRLADPVDAVIEDDEGIGTLSGGDALSAAWIARFGRTASDHVMQAVDGRLRARNDAGAWPALGAMSAPRPPSMPGHEPDRGSAPGRLVAAGPMVGGGASAGAMLAGPGPSPASAAGFVARGASHGSGGLYDAGGFHGPGGFPASAGARGRGGAAVAEGRSRQDPGMVLRDLLARSGFSWSPEPTGDDEAEQKRRWTLWGRGAKTRFDGREGSVALTGDVVGATLGVDAQWDRWTAGMALAWNEGRGVYSDGASGDGGDLRSTLTSVHPYARWAGDKLSVWGVLGHGRGAYAVRSNRPGRAAYTDLRMDMAGAGGRRDLATAERLGGIELALRADAMLVRMRADGVPGYLRETRTQTRHGRLYLEGARRYYVGRSGHLLTPSLELGARHDAGDADTGTGLEVAGRIQYENPARNLRVELHGHRLLTHQDDALAIWGAGGVLVYDADVDGLGLSLAMRPSWGMSGGGVADPWGLGGVTAGPRVDYGEPTGRLDTQVGYGLPLRGGDWTLKLLGASGIGGDGARSFSFGGTLLSGERSELSVVGERKTLAAGRPDLGILIRSRHVW